MRLLLMGVDYPWPTEVPMPGEHPLREYITINGHTHHSPIIGDIHPQGLLLNPDRLLGFDGWSDPDDFDDWEGYFISVPAELPGWHQVNGLWQKQAPFDWESGWIPFTHSSEPVIEGPFVYAADEPDDAIAESIRCIPPPPPPQFVYFFYQQAAQFIRDAWLSDLYDHPPFPSPVTRRHSSANLHPAELEWGMSLPSTTPIEYDECPECGEESLIVDEDDAMCVECGYSTWQNSAEDAP